MQQLLKQKEQQETGEQKQQDNKNENEIQIQEQLQLNREQKQTVDKDKLIWKPIQEQQPTQDKMSQISSNTKSDNLNLSFGTPDSSQTDSEGVSPQIRNKHKYTQARDILPKFSISIEDEQNRLVTLNLANILIILTVKGK